MLSRDAVFVFERAGRGDRFTRAKLLGAYYTISYDDVGRIILASGESDDGISFEYSYNDDGLLSHLVIYSYGFDEHYDYTWANGLLQKYEGKWISTGEEHEIMRRETCVFTWNGDILSSTDRHAESADGTSSVSRYDYEYTTSGGRIQTISETQISENTVGPTTMRITSEVLYEIEYAD